MTPHIQSRPSDLPGVLGVHPGALGDVVLFARLLQGLGGRVTLLTGGEKVRLLAGMGVVAEGIDFDAVPMHECFTDTPLTECELPGLLGRCDRLVSCFAEGNPAAELRLAALCGACDAAFLPIRPPGEFQGHLLTLWADLLGLPADPAAAPPWHVPGAWRRTARIELERAGVGPGRSYVVLHPGAGAPEKCWPLDRFAGLAERLPTGRDAVFVIGPVEQERWPASRLADLQRRFAVIGSQGLEVLAGLLAGAAAFVGNDSGPGHLAAAIGTPTLALFGPTRPEHFAPVGRAVRTLAAGTIADLTVDSVDSALVELLAETT